MLCSDLDYIQCITITTFADHMFEVIFTDATFCNGYEGFQGLLGILEISGIPEIPMFSGDSGRFI